MTPIYFLDTNVLDIYFKIVNQVLENIKQWFVSNVSHFSLREDIPPLLQKLIINNYETKRTESIKFFIITIFLDGNIRWKEHLKIK